MTRCLDCGSERTTDQCPSCGLTTAAAELTFRRRLMRQTGIFLLGSLAFPYISQIYPPLDLDLILVFFGLIFFGALTLAVILERRARNHQEIELMKRVYNGFIPLPWILAATLFINGRLDSQKNVVYYPTVVVGRFNMKGIVKGSRRLVVRSWRNPEPGANLDASIRGLAVGQHRQLDVEEAAVLAETETHALYWADVAYFPLGRFNGLIGNIGGRPLDVLSLGLHLFGIDFVDLLLFHIYKHVSLPQAHEQHAAFFTVVDIPGSRCVVVETHDGKLHRLPDRLFAAV